MNWLTLLPKLIALFAAIIEYAIAAKERGLGKAEATAEALTLAAEQVRQASQARAEAKADHVKTSDDSAFDQDFKR